MSPLQVRSRLLPHERVIADRWFANVIAGSADPQFNIQKSSMIVYGRELLRRPAGVTLGFGASRQRILLWLVRHWYALSFVLRNALRWWPAFLASGVR